jgi:hypothetical protein
MKPPITHKTCHPERSAAQSKDLRFSCRPAPPAATKACHPEQSAAQSKDLRFAVGREPIL